MDRKFIGWVLKVLLTFSSFFQLALCSQNENEFIAFANGDKIETFIEAQNSTQVPLPGPLPILQHSQYFKLLSGLAYDSKRQTFYYSEFGLASIHSVYSSNANHTTILAQNSTKPLTFVIAFEPTSNALFAIVYNDFKIIRLDLNLAPPTPDLVPVYKGSSLDKFRGLAVDPCERQIYWSNGNPKGPSIQKANIFDGLGLETIVSTEIKHPRALTLDFRNKHLYWGDRDLNKIEECDFDGRNRRVVVAGLADEFFGIAVTREWIYWTHKGDGTGTILRVGRKPETTMAAAKAIVVRKDLTARGIVAVGKEMELDECDRKPNLVKLNPESAANGQIIIWATKDAENDKNAARTTERLKCRYTEGNTTKSTWTHNNQEVFPNSYHLVNSIVVESQLEFKPVTPALAGNYVCNVSNQFMSEQINFTVKVCSLCIPQIDKSLKAVVLFKNQPNGLITCKYKSDAKSEVIWSRIQAQYATVLEESFSDALTGESVIKIEKVDDSVGGEYSCQVRNEFGHDSFKFQVNVVEEEENAISAASLAYILVGTGLIIFILICLILFLWKQYKIKRDLVRKLTPGEIKEFFEGNANANVYLNGEGAPGENSHATALSLPFDPNKEILTEHLLIFENSILGQGEFGLVYRGEFRGEPVAVKALKPKVEVEFVKAMLSELKIMAYIGDHPNIVQFLGAQTTRIEQNIVYVVVELSPGGDLHSYLKNNRSNIVQQRTYRNSVEQMTESEFIALGVYWSAQIALGMKYLEEKRVVHSDLAARNILIFSKQVVKISDFGLSRQLLNYSKYIKKSKSPLPFRWMALESLRFREFTCRSDVWSFGVTLWEIFSLAEFPYSEHNWTNEFVDQITAGMRLSQPKLATDEVYKQMTNCWHPDVSQRTTFGDLHEYFENLTMEIAKEPKSVEATTREPRRYENSPTRALLESSV